MCKIRFIWHVVNPLNYIIITIFNVVIHVKHIANYHMSIALSTQKWHVVRKEKRRKKEDLEMLQEKNVYK